MPEAINQGVSGISARSSGLTGPQTNLTSPSGSQLDAAKEKIAEMCLENNMVAVRPFVHGGGCSGMAHSMTFVEEKEKRE